MAYPVTGELGKVNSVTNGTDLDQVLETAVKTREITYTIDGENVETTGDGETAATFIAGLTGWGFNFSGLYPKSAPRFGNTGLVTFAAGYVQYVESWFIDFDFGEIEITSQATGGTTWREFRPAGYPTVTGGYTARAANATALSLPTGVGTAASAATFKITEDTTDPAFTGSIMTKQVGTTFGNGKNLVLGTYSFTFSGAVTAVAGTTLPALLPAGTVDAADWGDGTTGPATVAIVTQSFTSRTYTGYGFLSKLRVECNVGQPVAVTGTVKGSGALTLA